MEQTQPAMDDGSLAPQQARSRRTLQRLLDAAIAVLDAKGLAGATAPEIAAAAGVATGSIYRRFQDKDALFRAAFLNLLEGSVAANKAALRPEVFAGRTLEATLAALVGALVANYRARPVLLKALDQFLDSDADPVFRDRATALMAANLETLAAVLHLFEARVTAPDPARAITFALMSALTVIEVQALHAPLLWRRLMPLDDAALVSEVSAMMLAYLTQGDAG